MKLKKIAFKKFLNYNMKVKKLFALFAIIGLFAQKSFSQFCPSCIQNSASPQNAQFNISSATIRGQLSVGQLSISTITVSTITANTAIIGPGSLITNLNASNITSGNISSNSVVGAYPGINQVGILGAGEWEGTPIGTQYGGTGQNFINVSTGSLIYFGGNGSMDTLLPGAPLGILQSMGSAPEVWTSSPQVSGVNLYNIPLTSLNSGTLPTDITVSSNSIPYVSGTSVIGNISGEALGGFSGTVNLSQLSTGTLPSSVVASSITSTGVAAQTCGNGQNSCQSQIGSDGRIYSASQIPISISASSVTAGTFASGIYIPASQITAGNLPSGVVASSIAPTGVSSGTFGNAAAALQITNGLDGRLINVSTLPISIPASGINSPIQFSQLSTGTLPSSIVASSITVTGVSPGTCGNGTSVCSVNFGADGRAISAVQTAITGAPPSGAAGGALSGTYPNPSLAPSGVTAATYGSVNPNSVALPVLTINSAGQVTSASQQTFVPTSTATAFVNIQNPWTQTQTFPNVIVGPSLSSTTAPGNLSVSGLLTASSMTVSGVASVGGSLNANGSLTASSMTVSGVASVGGSLNANGSLTASSATITGNASVGGNSFSVGGSTLVVTSGNVGIGTTSPGAPLEVSGSNSNGVGLIVDKKIQIGTNYLNGIVFSVYGATDPTTGIIEQLATNTNDSASKLQFTDVNSYNIAIGADTSGNFVINQGEYPGNPTPSNFAVTPSGNVGIGTRSPGKLLTVAGNADFGTGTPTLSSCGTSPSLDSGSNDMRGEIVVGTSATGCTLTFSAAKTNVPFCLVASETSGLTSPGWTESTTPITITGVTAGDDYAYMCMGN